MTADVASEPAPPAVVPPAPVAPVAPSPAPRYLVVLGVVVFWMLVGWLLHLNGNAYLLFGVPLLALFQLFIARRPITELWIRPGVPWDLPGWGYAVAAAFMIAPALGLQNSWAHVGWSSRLWYVCAIAGALPLAFTVTRFSRPVLRSLLLCLATAGVMGVLLMVATAAARHRLDGLGMTHMWSGFRQFLIYLPVSFVLEEVFFRGGLDSYLYRPGDRWPWLSAAFVSVLWGLWHLPISGVRTPIQLLVFVTIVPVTHCLIGTALSLCWRRSGSLFVPASVHAFIDSVRNVLLY